MKKIIEKILCFLGFHDWIYYDTEDYYQTNQKIGCLRYSCDAE